jgi:Zn ribbon nucleic-acid-binding protein
MKTVSPKCLKCQSDKFELRLLRDEAVASARCVSCSADYLLLDSKDYWFDVIQKGYPRVTRCSCKHESFRLRIDYNIRDDGDIDHIEIHSICVACGKTRRQLDFEVDYCGTDHLLKKPLVPCKNPKVLYDLKDLNLLLSLPDMLRIIDCLAEQGCKFLSNVRRNDGWVAVLQNAAQAKATMAKSKYLFMYAMPDRVEVPKDQINTIKKEAAYWKRSEVIRIGSKSHVCTYQVAGYPTSICYCSEPQTHPSYTELGLSFYINFSTEFVRGEKVRQKSEAFRNATASLLAMLQNQFVSWRSPYRFDNPDVNTRVFADRFKKKARVKTK